MSFSDFASIDTQELYKKLGTSETGLSSAQAEAILKTNGPNVIKSKETTIWDIFRRQFKSPFVYLLLVASLLSFALGEKIDAGMILLFVAINTILGFYQEYKSEQTVKLLKKYLVSKIQVMRDGKLKNLDTGLMVPGDVLVFEPGDIIPADVRFIADHNLMVDETVLTGESVPVAKTSNVLNNKIKDIYQASNIGFSGTVVVSGRGTGVVFATAENTNYANIVKLAGETQKESSFEDEIAKFSKFTLAIVGATLLFVIITSIAIKPDPSLSELILFSVALAVSVIPEALPVVTTFSLSIGAYNLTKKSVIVKRLTSVEDMGALQVLATDKTGTLTQNKLEVANYYGDNHDDILLYCTLASYFTDESRNAQSNAFDLAFQKALGKKTKVEIARFKKLAEIPFDPERRRVTTLVTNNNKQYLISRGSYEEIIKLCKTTDDKVNDWVKAEGEEGRRSLAVAIKEYKGKVIGKNDESKMTFLGLISFNDPIKPSAYSAIEKAKSLGVSVKVITGDSPEVAGQVAKEIKLIESDSEIITGKDFEKLSLQEKHLAVSHYSVFARIIPEQKHQIIGLLKEKYYTGFLGEGINDAPALKASNVAVVVDGAADIAKEAADIVLLQKDLEVIMDGIMEGRRVFENTSKYITATMASNFGNFFAVALVAPFITFLPMLPLQILLVNLLSDFPMIMVATDNVDADVVKIPKRYNLKSFATRALSFGAISTVFDFTTFGIFFPMGEKQLQTYWFIESILTELLFLFSIRSAKSIFKAKSASKPLIYLTIIGAFFTVFIPFTELGEGLFGFVHPEAKGLLIVAAIVLAYLLANEGAKALLRKYSKNTNNT